MTWPISAVNTTNLDASTDDPSQARIDLLDLVQKFNDFVTNILTQDDNPNTTLMIDGTGQPPAILINSFQKKILNLVKPATASLVLTDVSNTFITNRTQPASSNVTLTLPIVSGGEMFRVFITALLNTGVYFEIKANGSNKIILNGTTGSSGGTIRATAQPVGSFITFYSVQLPTGVIVWIADPGSGTWTAQ